MIFLEKHESSLFALCCGGNVFVATKQGGSLGPSTMPFVICSNLLKCSRLCLKECGSLARVCSRVEFSLLPFMILTLFEYMAGSTKSLRAIPTFFGQNWSTSCCEWSWVFAFSVGFGSKSCQIPAFFWPLLRRGVFVATKQGGSLGPSMMLFVTCSNLLKCWRLCLQECGSLARFCSRVKNCVLPFWIWRFLSTWQVQLPESTSNA